MTKEDYMTQQLVQNFIDAGPVLWIIVVVFFLLCALCIGMDGSYKEHNDELGKDWSYKEHNDDE